jgi:hypothetical protein
MSSQVADLFGSTVFFETWREGHFPTCWACGKLLIGNQRKWCSNACNQHTRVWQMALDEYMGIRPRRKRNRSAEKPRG